MTEEQTPQANLFGRILESRSCKVQMIEDSISPDGIRLSTVQLRYWRPIHSELMTHRVFSRNARSSRAVPVVTLLSEAPYIPEFGSNKPGMQSGNKLEPEAMALAQELWGELIKETRLKVMALNELGVHKQWANRPLEWFGWIDVLVTSTDWANWFALRDHSDAMPEIAELAQLMHSAINGSQPRPLYYGEWHLPYILSEERIGAAAGYTPERLGQLQVLSGARCARLSYKPFDGAADYAKEEIRYSRLVGSSPVHASPTEHQATPDYKLELVLGKGQTIKVWGNNDRQGNFVGWQQARKFIPNEAVLDDHYDTGNF